MTFAEILKLVNQQDPLPISASTEEIFAYYALFGVCTAYGKCRITKSQCTAITADIRNMFEQLIECSFEVVENRRKQQQSIMAAEGKLTELMSKVVPGADCDELLLDAFDVIGIFEGMSGTPLRQNAENRLKGKMPLAERASDKPAKPAPKKKSTAKFQKPSLEELTDYITENQLNCDARAFLDYFESVGWKIGGKSAMKDWKAAVRNWSRRESKNNPAPERTASYDLEEFRNRAVHGELTYQKKEKTA